ncbi:hypothetical protein EW145_g578 [Phellinidium pouzarii]|uniref:Gfo/Idh/MocA-like oxidoreductase N-terminal domain-containing protein n=1 Tax=Phellinidium pouzarii TaxID=167371 RepID=A0A4V3XDY1_9AGAM|nr:hypothetical protein EW145_g578 [Phellinidium pouzarii]
MTLSYEAFEVGLCRRRVASTVVDVFDFWVLSASALSSMVPRPKPVHVSNQDKRSSTMNVSLTVNGKVNGSQLDEDIGTLAPVTFAVIGCGQRGTAYAEYALRAPDKCKVVAIAEPRPKTRTAMATAHSVDASLVFHTWEDFHAASVETLKTTVALAFASQGYHILCEKPMATSVEDCVRIADAVKKAGIIFGMGHVLRYSPYSKAMTKIIHSGSLGRLINIQYLEPIGHYHFAHSYVRGSWSKENDSSFSLMTKSSHDIDIICSMLAPETPIRVSSFGSLQHFKKAAKPPAAGDATRCLDCSIEQECPYSAKSIYLDRVKSGNTRWPASTIVDGVPDIENINEALQNGPYGKCVYESDNDVVDNQTCLASPSPTSAHSHAPPVSQQRRQCTAPRRKAGGHGGGDLGLISTFVRAVRTGQQDLLGTDVDEVLKSHLAVFAAEKSRLEGRVINVAEFEKEAKTMFLEH